MATSAPLTIDAAIPGRWGVVRYVVRVSGQCQAEEFLDDDCAKIHATGNRQATAKAKFLALFQQMANEGLDGVSKKHFRKEMGKLWAFHLEVGNVQIRFPCFQDGHAWLITTGFKKKGAKKGFGAWRKEDIDRAEAIEAEYWQRKALAVKQGLKKR